MFSTASRFTCVSSRLLSKRVCIPIRFHGSHSNDNSKHESITINWVNKDDSISSYEAEVGTNLLRAAQKHHIELEGACEGVCACSTCHCILQKPVYDSLPEPSEEEEDMLDQAFGLTSTSRLGCQVTVTKDMDGITIILPKYTRNFYVVSLEYFC